MTICYGVTILGATEQVRNKLRDMLGAKVDEGTVRQMARYLAQSILNSVDEVFDRAMRIKRWFDAVSGVFSQVNMPCSWVTPFGLAVSQPYFLQTSAVVKTALQSVTLKKNDGNEVDARHQKCGFPPNFVHSLDAAHMMMVAERMMLEPPHEAVRENKQDGSHAVNHDRARSFYSDQQCPQVASWGNNVTALGGTSFESAFTPATASNSTTTSSSIFEEEQALVTRKRYFAMVHDSFWCHAADVDFMNKAIRDTFIELHSRPLLEELERDFKLLLGEKWDMLPKLPPRTQDLDLNRVRESLYFFD
ncbi:unnamed protein product [Amoebophrya sp. A25]|nr:unnamed protein product [Amoebophrya sp. A25]|eukprot:GSA25T00000431001.1